MSSDAQVAAMSKAELQEFIQQLLDLMMQMVEFMLSKLACASPNGSGS